MIWIACGYCHCGYALWVSQHGCSLHLNFVQPAELKFFAWGTWIWNCWFSVSSDFSLFFILHARHDCDSIKNQIKFKSPKILPKHIMLGGLAFITLKIVLLQTVVWRILYLVCFPPIVWRVAADSCLKNLIPSLFPANCLKSGLVSADYLKTLMPACILLSFADPRKAAPWEHSDRRVCGVHLLPESVPATCTCHKIHPLWHGTSHQTVYLFPLKKQQQTNTFWCRFVVAVAFPGWTWEGGGSPSIIMPLYIDKCIT